MLRTDGKSFPPIHPLPILTDTDSNRFLGLLTIPIPIPIFIYEYHTDTDFAKNTDTDTDYTDYRSNPISYNKQGFLFKLKLSFALSSDVSTLKVVLIEVIIMLNQAEAQPISCDRAQG